MISVPPQFLSMYCGFFAWWTRWFDGVLNTASRPGSLPMYGVWVRKSHALPIAITTPNASGGKPNAIGGTENTQSIAPPTHELRRPTDRFSWRGLWCAKCEAHMKRNAWLARCDQ